MSKCKGCGITLQYEDSAKPGYTPKKEAKLCQRCFKIANYNAHDIQGSFISDEKLIAKINAQRVFTFFLVDILSLNQNVLSLYQQITNPKCLLLTKVDIIPKNFDRISLEKKLNKIYGLDDVLFSSSVNGYGKAEIISLCEEKKNVLFVGPSSSGKSSLINYLFDQDLTVSSHRNTTQDFIKIKCDGFTVIDAPGFNEKIKPNEEKLKGNIKPKTMSIKKAYALIIEDRLISFDKDTNITLFFPDNVTIKTKKMDITGNKLELEAKSDLVLESIGFIYFKDKTSITVANIDNLEVRESIVGYYE